ncbi:MAG: hypothetical protein C5B50_05425 [Verrucomicrobia bacterium]|nr:MAG: hypothetical protein C5B50_05425 [Verrucomicrobiota bacterium]
MRRATIKILLLVFLLHSAAGQSVNPIQQLPLNPMVLARIPVAMTGPTTIRFPSPISDLEGAFVSSDANSPALFLLSFRPGSSFFSIRALRANTNATLNVVWKDQTYVLELEESKTPWFSVIFAQAPSPAAPAPRQSVTPSRLLGLLDTAKAFPLLKKQHPEAVANVQCIRPDTLNDYGDYTIRTEEVFRFDDADTLVFRIAISNKTMQVMHYLPQSLMVQTGRRVFYQSITDGTGEVPPQKAAPVYFSVTGTPDGGRNEVSPQNEFLVLLHRTDPPITVVPTNLPPAAAQPATGNSQLEPTIAAPPVSESRTQPSNKNYASAISAGLGIHPTATASPQPSPAAGLSYASSPPAVQSAPVTYVNPPTVQYQYPVYYCYCYPTPQPYSYYPQPYYYYYPAPRYYYSSAPYSVYAARPQNRILSFDRAFGHVR